MNPAATGTALTLIADEKRTARIQQNGMPLSKRAAHGRRSLLGLLMAADTLEEFGQADVANEMRRILVEESHVDSVERLRECCSV